MKLTYSLRVPRRVVRIEYNYQEIRGTGRSRTICVASRENYHSKNFQTAMLVIRQIVKAYHHLSAKDIVAIILSGQENGHCLIYVMMNDQRLNITCFHLQLPTHCCSVIIEKLVHYAK